MLVSLKKADGIEVTKMTKLLIETSTHTLDISYVCWLKFLPIKDKRSFLNREHNNKKIQLIIIGS